jgi:hypothetical protein
MRSNEGRLSRSAPYTDLDLAYKLTQAFVSMLADHRDTDLDSWLAQAEQSGMRSPQKLCYWHPTRLRRCACRVRFFAV